jgi:hypothetical protein
MGHPAAEIRGAEALFLLCAGDAALKRRSSTVALAVVVILQVRTERSRGREQEQKATSRAAGEGARSTPRTAAAGGPKGPLTVRAYKTRVGDEVVTTFSSFQVP